MSNTEPESDLPSFGEPDQPEPVQEEDLGLAAKFLPNIPPQDREVVNRYIKQWDAGVTKRFQEYAGKLKPYESLGPAEEVQRYVNIARNLQADPERVFRLIWQGMQEHYGDEFDQHLLKVLELEGVDMSEYQQQQPAYEPDFEDPNAVFQQNVSTELQELRAWKEQQEQAKVEAEQNQQLDSALSAMHNKYGEFDDNWVLVRLAEHGDVDRAVKEWNAMLSKFGGRTQRLAPKVMGGQGGVPSNQIDPKTLRGKDRRDIVAQMLSQGE